MTNRTDHDALLADVLAETVPGELRAALLETTLRTVRRRRHVRVVRRVGGMTVVVIALVLAATWWMQGRGTAERLGEGRCAIVHTRALAADAIVATRALEPGRVVSSQTFFAVVRTQPGDGVRLIGDAELLALASPGALVLVRVGPHSQEAVFVEEGGRSERGRQ